MIDPSLLAVWQRNDTGRSCLYLRTVLAEIIESVIHYAVNSNEYRILAPSPGIDNNRALTPGLTFGIKDRMQSLRYRDLVIQHPPFGRIETEGMVHTVEDTEPFFDGSKCS